VQKTKQAAEEMRRTAIHMKNSAMNSTQCTRKGRIWEDMIYVESQTNGNEAGYRMVPEITEEASAD
jgi:hypothetical protein